MFRYAPPDDDGLDAFLSDGAYRPAAPRRADPALIGGVEPLAGYVRGGRLARLFGRRSGLTGPLLAAALMATIGGNALFLQNEPHPAPLFSERSPSLAAAVAEKDSTEAVTPAAVGSIPLPTARPRPEGHVAAAPDTAATARIRELQSMLGQLGYYKGEADGIAGPATAAALRRYEAENRLVPVGEISPAILDHVRLTLSRREDAGRQERKDAIAELVETRRAAAGAPAPSFDDGVAEVQRVLAMLGYSPGPIDGQMGEATRKAIAAFRNDNHLPPVDRIDAVLIHALQEFSGVKLARGG